MDAGSPSIRLYQYKPLKTSTSVRFLRITEKNSYKRFLPGLVPEIEYDLVEYDLQDIDVNSAGSSVPYVGVSYVWGTAPRSKTFQLLDQKNLSITPTLERAIPHITRAVLNIHNHSVAGYLASHLFRKRSGGCLFWIDQICINQQNAAEREQQVRLMQDLYSKADDVVV